MTAPLRIANCSGFYGDRVSAAREMVEGGPIDVLTGDYLAELTMLILWKSRQKDPAGGYATTFERQMEQVLGTCLDRGIKVVANAGGLNPAGLAERLRQLAESLGLRAKVAHVEGDDIVARVPALQAEGVVLTHLDDGRPLAEAGSRPVSANAYLGGFGIAAALADGADVVVTGRVTDASLVVGPAVWRFGWARDDWDRLAGAVAAGHVIECGAQATGGNYAFFRQVPGLEHPGFPIAEMAEDGSAVITKHPGTGGAVTVGTVTAQLLYEIAGPLYPNADVVADFSTVALTQVGEDRVRLSGARGLPAPEELKVTVNLVGGWRNTMTFVLTGLDIEAKAELARRALLASVGGPDQFHTFETRLIRRDRPDAPTNELASAELRVTVKDADPAKVGRRFSSAVIELALANYPGFYLTSPPGDASAYGVYWPALVPRSAVDETVVHHDGRRQVIAPPPPAPEASRLAASGAPDASTTPTGEATGTGDASTTPTVEATGTGDASTTPTVEATGTGEASTPTGEASTPTGEATGTGEGPTRRLPLGTLVGARSGDKGGNANVGLWAQSPAAFAWLRQTVTTQRFRELLPEAATLRIDRFELPNLLAVNFVVHELLGEGVASSTRPDAQAKSLGEYVRSRLVDVPEALLAGAAGAAGGGSSAGPSSRAGVGTGSGAAAAGPPGRPAAASTPPAAGPSRL